MKKILFASLACAASVFSASAFSAQGEYWEVSVKMEMPGMPFAMPATTSKVCIPKGGEKDPQRAAASKECVMTDIKTSGNKSSWKFKCNQDGEIMTGSGELSGNAHEYRGVMHMSGKSGGEDMKMTQTYHGKHIGGSCDADEMMNKIKGEMCDSSKFTTTAEWISSAELFLKNKTCPDKKVPLCAAVRKDAPQDVSVYQTLLAIEKINGGFIAKTCGLSMVATTKALCKTMNEKNVGALSTYCPAEAKIYRENARRKACEGRSYTSHEDLSKCLKGKSSVNADEDSAGEPQPTDGESKSKSGSNPVGTVLDGAKKLKGIFGF